MEGRLSVQQDLEVRLPAVSRCRTDLLVRRVPVCLRFWFSFAVEESTASPLGSYAAGNGFMKRWLGCMGSPAAVL